MSLDNRHSSAIFSLSSRFPFTRDRYTGVRPRCGFASRIKGALSGHIVPRSSRIIRTSELSRRVQNLTGRALLATGVPEARNEPDEETGSGKRGHRVVHYQTGVKNPSRLTWSGAGAGIRRLGWRAVCDNMPGRVLRTGLTHFHTRARFRASPPRKGSPGFLATTGTHFPANGDRGSSPHSTAGGSNRRPQPLRAA